MKKEAGKKDNQWKENLAVSAILSVLFGLDWASGFLLALMSRWISYGSLSSGSSLSLTAHRECSYSMCTS